ncbi:MAG: radical SAM protein [Vulcanimicrobiota bacterium]
MGQRLSPVIKLTESCNLACSYCYQQGQLKPGQRMSPETLERICAELALNCRPPIPLLWYGGEPTLIGLAAFRRAVECARRHLGHLGLEHSLQSNGLLLDPEWVEFLARQKFRVRLSLDGPADLHDRSRPRVGGGGSHARVIGSLRRLQQSELAVRVACTVTRHSLGRARELVHYFEHLNLREVDFSPALRLGDHQAWIDGPEYGQFLVEALDAWFELPEPLLQIRSLAALIRKHHGLDPGYCKLEGTCSRFLTFGWEGSVYPCDEFAPKLCLGDVTLR